MTVIEFEITFHGPFSISTGSASRGIDATADRKIPIAASGLKGLMRSQAEHVLRIDQRTIAAVFGDSTHPCPWGWNDAVNTGPQTSTDASGKPSKPGRRWNPERFARIRVDDDGLVEAGTLLVGEHMWASTASVEVEQILPLDQREIATHTVVLRAAARSVSSMGGGRRRGEGWVSMVDDTAWTLQDTQALKQLVEGATE